MGESLKLSGKSFRFTPVNHQLTGIDSIFTGAFLCFIPVSFGLTKMKQKLTVVNSGFIPV